jgi:hypothetical protein
LVDKGDAETGTAAPSRSDSSGVVMRRAEITRNDSAGDGGRPSAPMVAFDWPGEVPDLLDEGIETRRALAKKEVDRWPGDGRGLRWIGWPTDAVSAVVCCWASSASIEKDAEVGDFG